MVRPRLQLERLSGELSREHYYLHSKSVVTKKVKEMSVLTGTDLLVLTFSPAGIPTLHLGENSDLINVMTRYSEISYNDREKRRLDNLQTLRANYQKEGYNIDVHTLFHAWKVKKLQEKRDELAKLIEELNELNNKKSLLENPKHFNNIDMINEMEERLKKSLEGVRQRKDELIAKQTTVEATVGPFEEYIPEMLSGNDDLLGYANILMSGNQATSSEEQYP